MLQVFQGQQSSFLHQFSITMQHTNTLLDSVTLAREEVLHLLSPFYEDAIELSVALVKCSFLLIC